MTNLETVLATVGLNDKRHSKADAQAALREIIEQLPHEMLERHSTAKALGGLYMYFLPPAGKVIKDPFEWVAQAVSADPNSPTPMRMVQVCCRGWMLASDGFRMHAARKDGMEAGAYNQKTKQRVGDEDDGYIKNLLNIARYKEHSCQHSARSSYPIDRSGRHHIIDVHGNFIQLIYYREAMRMGGAAWVRTPGNANGPVRFDFSDGRKALIMPFANENNQGITK